MTDKDLIELHIRLTQEYKKANPFILTGMNILMERICSRLDLERNLSIASKPLPIEK